MRTNSLYQGLYNSSGLQIWLIKWHAGTIFFLWRVFTQISSVCVHKWSTTVGLMVMIYAPLLATNHFAKSPVKNYITHNLKRATHQLVALIRNHWKKNFSSEKQASLKYVTCALSTNPGWSHTHKVLWITSLFSLGCCIFVVQNL